MPQNHETGDSSLFHEYKDVNDDLSVKIADRSVSKVKSSGNENIK